MNGTNAQNGKSLADLDHLRQSIRDILTTPIGTRVMRREYGSRLFELVDAPINRTTIADIYAATVEAIAKWEPRVEITSVTLAAASAGQITLNMNGKYLPDGSLINIDGVVVK